MSRNGEQYVFLGMPAVIESDAMRSLLSLVKRVAALEASVLITGESGVGKELIARALHEFSPRASRPWVDVSCAALPEHLVESELFGHEKGAYSSAESAKPGLFELADQGTLFLDEIGELEPRMQVKLLRVLDGAPYYRLGGTKKITVNVRVVAATNQDLGEMVRKERFRPDLYHRLSEIHLEVPPLRRRRSDILPLAEYFLTQLKQGKRLSHEVQQALLRYHWPGNARELRNVLLRAAVAAPGEEIVAYHLPKQFAGVPVAETPASELKALAAAVDGAGPAGEGEWSLEAMERRAILQVLNKTGGHQQKAAELLGISRRTLSRKLKLYAMTSGSAA